MARLSYDGLLLLAKVAPGTPVTITHIAVNVFDGFDPAAPSQPKRVAMARAKRAVNNVIAMKRATGTPTNFAPTSIECHDDSGGSLQAQALMNLVVRGGIDRRKDDRRGIERDNTNDRRAPREDQPTAKAKRIVRSYNGSTAAPPRKPSPFDIPTTSILSRDKITKVKPD